VQITDARMNGLRYRAFQEGDFYTSITLDKILAKDGILRLSDSDLELMLEKKVQKETIVATK
jgi:hypothetical protein